MLLARKLAYQPIWKFPPVGWFTWLYDIVTDDFYLFWKNGTPPICRPGLTQVEMAKEWGVSKPRINAKMKRIRQLATKVNAMPDIGTNSHQGQSQ